MNKIDNEYIYEELTMAEFSDKFLNNSDFKTPAEYDISGFDIEICTTDSNTTEIYKPMTHFIVKPSVDHYYTDGVLNGAENHKLVENNSEIFINEHPEFKKINAPLDIVDLQVEDGVYFANGRINHNTTSGGKALAFHCSGRLQASQIGKIKGKINDVEQVIGIRTKVKVIKSRMGPPHRSAEFDIYFDRGIDNESEIIDELEKYKQIEKSGLSYVWTDKETGELIKFRKKDYKQILIKYPNIYDQMYKAICDCVIMKYKKQGEIATSEEIESTVDTGDVENE